MGVPLFGRAQGLPARGTCCCRSPCAGSNRVPESPCGDADALGSDLAARGARPRAGERKEARRPARRWPLGTVSPPPVGGRAFDPADGAAPPPPPGRGDRPLRARCPASSQPQPLVRWSWSAIFLCSVGSTGSLRAGRPRGSNEPMQTEGLARCLVLTFSRRH